jgi:2-polyprenyl-6-methoxyphenol hydroxylase-like FAD-dependent oxidoreductase
MQFAPGQSTAVLVVGAGPAGLVLGCELARREVPFRLIDRLPHPANESRAIVVHARSLEMMERIGVVQPLIDSGVRTTAMTFHGDHKVLRRLDLDIVDSPYPFSVSTAQTETERVLTARLAELGVTIDRGVELVGLEQHDRHVRSTLHRPDGSEEIVNSGWIVGADGRNSTVREQVGATLEGSFKRERFLLGDVEADDELDRASIHGFFSPDDGPLLVVPMRDHRLRLVAQLVDERDGVEPTLERLQEIADRRAGGIALRSARWLTTFETHSAQVPEYRYGRAFLAGDAAHVHSPVGGRGMNTGMQDAFNLGWKLALVATGKAIAALLDSYNAERHPVAAQLIAHAVRMSQVGTLDSELAGRLRNQAVKVATGLAPIRQRLAAHTEETDVAYRDSPIVLAADNRDDEPRPGDAAPDVRELGLHQVLARGLWHTALYVAPAGDAEPPAGSEPGRSVLVTDSPRPPSGFDQVVVDPERKLTARYGLDHDDGGLILVRPDGYIGLRAELGDQRAIADYLVRIGKG